MTSFQVPRLCPLRAEDEQVAIEVHAAKLTRVRHMLEKEYSLERLESSLEDELRDGGLDIATLAVAAADKGDPITDKALRQVGAELQIALLQKRGLAPGHLQIIAYLQAAVSRAPNTRKPGRYGEQDTWSRNVSICVLVLLACAAFGVSPTRNIESRRAGRYPSGISITAAALAINGIHISEATIQRHIWPGICGEIVRRMPDEPS